MMVWEKNNENNYRIVVGDWIFSLTSHKSSIPGCDKRYQFQVYQEDIPQTASALTVHLDENSFVERFFESHDQAIKHIREHSYKLTNYNGLPKEEKVQALSILEKLCRV